MHDPDPIPADPALELLCLLSPTPSKTSDLVSDLRLGSRRELGVLVGKLTERGYGITHVGQGGGKLVLRGADMPRAERACVAYLASVYGE